MGRGIMSSLLLSPRPIPGIVPLVSLMCCYPTPCVTSYGIR